MPFTRKTKSVKSHGPLGLKSARIPAAQPAVASLPAAHAPKVGDVQPAPKKLTKRNHHEPRPTPPAPEPPNPHVLELQGQIIKLVNMREALQAREAEATDTAAVAQAQLQSARSSLQRVESEVNYRIELIAKLTGVPTPRFAHVSEVAHYPDVDPNQGLFAVHTSIPAMPSGIGSMGSIPASRPMVGGGPEGNVRMDSAEDIRRSL